MTGEIKEHSMLKLKFNKKIVLGLDKNNIERLTKGQPIHIEAKDLKLEDDIYIVYGDSLLDIAKELKVEHLLETYEVDGVPVVRLDLSDEGKK
jgi:uncharacterized protein YxjI